MQTNRETASVEWSEREKRRKRIRKRHTQTDRDKGRNTVRVMKD